MPPAAVPRRLYFDAIFKSCECGWSIKKKKQSLFSVLFCRSRSSGFYFIPPPVKDYLKCLKREHQQCGSVLFKLEVLVE